MKTILLLTICTLLLVSCKKTEVHQPEATGRVMFYTNQPGHWNLIFDGREYGQLKKDPSIPVCSDPDFINMTLAIGTYTIDAKNYDGYAWGNPRTITVSANQCESIRLP